MSFYINATNVIAYLTNADQVSVKVDAVTSKSLLAAIQDGEALAKVEKGMLHTAMVTSLPNTGVGYSPLCPVTGVGPYSLIL